MLLDSRLGREKRFWTEQQEVGRGLTKSNNIMHVVTDRNQNCCQQLYDTELLLSYSYCMQLCDT